MGRQKANTANGLAVAAVLTAAILWGTTGTAQAMLGGAVDPIWIGALRMLLGAATLWSLCLVVGRSDLRLAHVRSCWLAILCAGIAIGSYNLFFFEAVLRAGVGVGTMLTIGSAPIWATLIQSALGNRPTLPALFGQAMCIAGASFLVIGSDTGTVEPMGVLLALLSGLGYAIYSLFTSRAAQTVGPLPLAAASFTVAATLTTPFAAITTAPPALGTTTIAIVLFLGVIATGFAYAIYTFGLRTVQPSTAITLVLAEPLSAWLLAIVVVGEAASAPQMLGAVVLLTGLWIVIRVSRSTAATRLQSAGATA
ncbi:MAG: DMT family transporter [Pseudomonadota bacterium]